MNKINKILLFLCFLFSFSTVNAQFFLKKTEFLEPEQAFQPEISVLENNEILIHYKIAPNYYLYKDRFSFEIENAEILETIFPQGTIKNDEHFGEVEVYYNDVPIQLKIKTQKIGLLNIKATSQGCVENGVCYLPLTQNLEVELKEIIQESPTIIQDESHKILNQLKNTDFLANLFFFFLAGVGLSLTPCVLPMIPILSGIIIEQNKAENQKLHHFWLSLFYVLGMALTYTIAGVAAGLSGTLFSAFLQNPWVLSAFALIFVFLAFSMFGFYELQMPQFVQNCLSKKINTKKGSFVSVFVMGALSALIVGPCVAAPLAGALMYIGQTGDAFLGGFSLFLMALGMGLPLIVVGVLGSSFLPKTGVWMISIKYFFGVVLLALALWIIHPILNIQILMFLWASLFIITAIYFKALDSLPDKANNFQRFLKGIGILLFLIGVIFLIGAFSGAKDFAQPLNNLIVQNNKTPSKEYNFKIIKTNDELNAELQNSLKPIMLDFYADWCVTCKEMERFTFSDDMVFNKLKNYNLLKIDVTNNTAEDQKILKRFSLFGPPAILFFEKGEEKNRIVGFKNAKEFLKIF